jgi:ABC-type Fe3+-hydroxamate transport system substrate-binding protein
MFVKVTDQLNREVYLPTFPKRIISIVPSQTELLYDLGLDERVVGITKFCIHPNDWFKNKVRIGGTKNLKLSLIEGLQPDLIIGNKEENSKSDIEYLEKKFPVWMSEIVTLEDSLDAIKKIGSLTNSKNKSESICQNILNESEKFVSSTCKLSGTFLYLIWYNPIMAAGKNTFIDSMCNYLGLNNCLTQNRYPEINSADLKVLRPNYIFLSSEPFPFKEKHIQEIQNYFPNAKVILVDGELFSWHGSRLLHSFRYFSELIKTAIN